MTHAQEVLGLPSASGFDAFFRCPGKFLMEKQFPEDESSVDAARGHRIHEALKRSDLSGLSASESLTASICMDIEGQLIEQNNFEHSDEVIWEERYWDVDDDFTKLWSARLDYVRLSGHRALVINHKTGWGLPTPIERNWQIRAEAGIVWLHHGVDEVIAALAHPHHPDGPMEVIRLSAKRCAEAMMQIRARVAQIQVPDQPRYPNAISCQYCKAKHICPERQQWLNKIATDVRNEIAERGYTSLIDRTPQERGKHYQSLKELKAHIELLMEKYATMASKEEGSVAGWKTSRKWDRKIADEAEAMARVEREFGEKVAHESMIFSLTECEALIQKSLGIGKRKASDKLEALLKDLIKFKPSREWLIEARNYYENNQ